MLTHFRNTNHSHLTSAYTILVLLKYIPSYYYLIKGQLPNEITLLVI